MTANKELQEFVKALEESSKGNVPINTTFDHETTVALFKFVKAKKIGKKPQDAIRFLVISGLQKAGFLNN